MKLKYYMRGLGIGILITTIVLSIGNKREKLSDNEVMAKARELGMVMQDDIDRSLEEVLEKSLEKNLPDPVLPDPVLPDPVPDPVPGTDETVPGTDETVPGTDETVPGTDETVPGTDETVPGTDETVPGTDEVDITFTIVRGMSSRQVSELIMDKGLISDAVDFDNYIKQKGKASVIRVGTYTLPEDSDYQKILDTITS